MSNWRDTLMNDEQIKEVLRGTYGFGIELEKGHFAVARRQAEIAFKAGREQGLKECPEPWDREQTIFEDGKKAGIKEVVEWLAEYKFIEHPYDYYKFRQDDLEAKLKEWGINET